MNLQEINGMYTDFTRYVDVEGGLSRIMKNKKIYGMLLNKFVENTYYGELTEKLAAGNAEEAERAAHTIKGVAANLSLPLIYEISADMDQRLKLGDMNVQQELMELGEVIGKTVEYIKIVLENLDSIEV